MDMKGDERMRRLLLLMTLFLLAFLLTGCTAARPSFDPETEGTVDVIVCEDDRLLYYAATGDGRMQQIDAFTGDDINVYHAEGYHVQVFDENGDVAVQLFDEDGMPVENTPEMEAVLRAAGTIDHWIMQCRVLQAGEAWFLYVELNVNLWSPCELYWYDPARDGLVEIVRLDGKKTVGLRVRDLTRLAQQPLYAP